MGRVWNSTIDRNTPLRSRSRMKRTPLNPVNRERKARRYERDFGDYAATIRNLPCCVCGRVPRPPTYSHPHHVRSRGAGGDKRDLVPVCHREHLLIHLMGRESFEARYEISLASIAADLWSQYGTAATPTEEEGTSDSCASTPESEAGSGDSVEEGK